MDLQLGAADLRFRDEVRRFLEAELTDDLREAGLTCAGIYCDYPVANRWHRILAARGWSTPAWPVEYGGCGWSPLQQYIFDCEMADAGAPPLTPNATHMVGPVIIAFGSEAQKAHYLPRIRAGDDWWAQGYSEPDAGSDLASLRCAAVRDGDHYVINGQKIWTTHAHVSNRIFCLVRTRTEDKPQKGISFLLFDLDLPGVEIRPILSLSGDHELNEVFFRGVRVPVSGLLGEENQGWTVAKHLLQHERSHTWSPLLRARMRRLKARAAQTPSGLGAPLIDEPAFRRELAEAEIQLSALEVGELRMLMAVEGDAPLSGVASSTMKIAGTELRQRLAEIALEVEGAAGRVCVPAPSSSNEIYAPASLARRIYLNDRAASIYAGANEVQRNIVAGALLR